MADAPQFLNRQEAADELRLSLSSLDAALARGEIRSVRIGKRILIPATELERLIAEAV